jgi:hypothetical protein
LKREEGIAVQYWKRKGLRLSRYSADLERVIAVQNVDGIAPLYKVAKVAAVQSGKGSRCTKWRGFLLYSVVATVQCCRYCTMCERRG